MQCTYCGNPLKPNSRFCPGCGTIVPQRPGEGQGRAPHGQQPASGPPPPPLGYGQQQPPGYGPPAQQPGYQVPASAHHQEMVKIKGLEGMSPAQLRMELDRGGKFVVYEYCISVLVMTFKRSSAIHFVRADQSRVARGLGYIGLSLLLGWWGIPWGPIFTVTALVTDFKGGSDVTPQVAPIVLAGQ